MADATVPPPTLEAIAAAAGALRSAKRVWLTTHIKSDGDGIGCELALVRALRSLGIEARAINATVVPRGMEFLQRSELEVALYDPARDDTFLRSADAIVVLDVGLAYRLGSLEAHFRESTAVKFCVDHHLESDPLFDFFLADPVLNATGELVLPLVKAMGVSLTEEIATPLFASISSDSGSFSYERCTAATFEAAAELVAAGAKPYPLHVNLRWRRPLEEVRLEGEIIGGLATDESGLVAWSAVSRESLDYHGVDPMDMPEWVNIPLSLEGVEVALLFVEMEPGTIKVSARGKGRVRVSDLARLFGGGGHPLAAGFSVSGSLTEARNAVVPAARRLLGLPEGHIAAG